MLTEPSWSWSLGFCFNRATHNVIFIRFWSYHLYSDRLPNYKLTEERLHNTRVFSFPWGTCCSVHIGCIVDSRAQGGLSVDRCVFIQPQLTVVYLVKSAMIGVWSYRCLSCLRRTQRWSVCGLYNHSWQSFTWWNQRWSVCGCIVDSFLHDEISVDQCVIVSLTVFYMLKSALISVWLHRWQSFTWWNLRWSMCGCIVDSLLHDQISVDQCVVVLLTVVPKVKSLFRVVCVIVLFVDSHLLGEVNVDQCMVVSLKVAHRQYSVLISI